MGFQKLRSQDWCNYSYQTEMSTNTHDEQRSSDRAGTREESGAVSYKAGSDFVFSSKWWYLIQGRLLAVFFFSFASSLIFLKKYCTTIALILMTGYLGLRGQEMILGGPSIPNGL